MQALGMAEASRYMLHVDICMYMFLFKNRYIYIYIYRYPRGMYACMYVCSCDILPQTPISITEGLIKDDRICQNERQECNGLLTLTFAVVAEPSKMIM